MTYIEIKIGIMEFNLLNFITTLQDKFEKENGKINLNLTMPSKDKVIIYDSEDDTEVAEIISFTFPAEITEQIVKLKDLKLRMCEAFPLYTLEFSLPYGVKIIIPKSEEEKCSYNICAVVNMRVIQFFGGNHEQIPSFDIVVSK